MVSSIPLFPLGTVLFPGVMLPLHIFEPRYRMLIRDLMAAPEGSRAFGVVGIREGREVGIGAISQLHAIGCTAELRRVEALPDGRFYIVATGGSRFRVLDLDTSEELARAAVEFLDEPETDGADEVAEQVAAAFMRYYHALLAAQGNASDDDLDLPDRPRDLAYAVADAMLLDDGEKQQLLAASSTNTRLEMELALLQRETAMVGQFGMRPAVELQHPAYNEN
jgi:Lon protease-like protein